MVAAGGSGKKMVDYAQELDIFGAQWERMVLCG